MSFFRQDRKAESAGLLRSLLLVGLLAFTLYLPGFWWGAPHATAFDRKQSWGVDDETPLGPLAEIHNIIQPKDDRNLGYPLMFSFTAAAAYSPYLAYLWITEQWKDISATYPFGMSDPVGTLKSLTYIAHFVTVLMGVGIVIAAFLTVDALWGRKEAFGAAILVALIHPLTYYSKNGNVDVPALFFAALGIAVFARCLAEGFSARRAAYLGVAAGFAVATKEAAAGIFLVVPFILYATSTAVSREPFAFGRTKSFWRCALIGVVASLTAFGIGSGLFIEPGRYFAHLSFLAERLEQVRAGELIMGGTYDYSWQGNVQYLKVMLRHLIEMMTAPGLLLGSLGIIWSIKRKEKGALLALAVLAYLIYIFFTIRLIQLRYLLPAAYLVSLFGGTFAVRLVRDHRGVVRIIAASMLIWVVGFGLLSSIALTYEMINDSRYTAARWLDDHTEPGDVVEYFGPVQKLPPLKAGVVTRPATEYYGIYVKTPTDALQAKKIVDGWVVRSPEFIITLPDLTSPEGVDHNISCPPHVYESLLEGVVGYELAAKFHTRPLLPWYRKRRLDYPTVNPPIRIFARKKDTARLGKKLDLEK